MAGENQGSWFLFPAPDSGWGIIQSGTGSPLANHGINLPTFVELGLELFQYPLVYVGTGVPENGFSVFFKALLSYGDKETIRIFPRCSCIWWEARKFVSFFKEKS